MTYRLVGGIFHRNSRPSGELRCRARAAAFRRKEFGLSLASISTKKFFHHPFLRDPVQLPWKDRSRPSVWRSRNRFQWEDKCFFGYLCNQPRRHFSKKRILAGGSISINSPAGSLFLTLHKPKTLARSNCSLMANSRELARDQRLEIHIKLATPKLWADISHSRHSPFHLWQLEILFRVSLRKEEEKCCYWLGRREIENWMAETPAWSVSLWFKAKSHERK